jgi:hypothetical protein
MVFWCLACVDSGSDARYAPGLCFADIEIERPAAQGNGIGGDGNQNGGDEPEPAPPDEGGSVAGNTAFPPELQDIAGQLPHVRPVEEFLLRFGETPDQASAAAPNSPPSASFVMSPDCIRVVDSVHSFVLTASDPDGDALSCEWTFAGGIPPGSGACAIDNVSFDGVGAATLELIVEDGRGGRDSVARAIEPCL